MGSFESALKLSAAGLALNAALAAIKIGAGVFGNSYVLIADGIESAADVFSSFAVWAGLRVAVLPADANHPYGHGKAESIASAIVSLSLLGAAIIIAVQSLREIMVPQGPPRTFTLVVLVLVIVIKEFLFRRMVRAGASLGSRALQADAWHHRSDSLTSAAAFVGISIALLGGPGFETADDWAALVACGIIAWNGVRLLRGTLDDIMDAAVSPEITAEVRTLAGGVEGVIEVEKCRIRKVGLHLALDIHVVVDGNLSVRRGHAIAHEVEAKLRASEHRINDVTVHIEPDRF
ncbi:MAG TPA: cation diffusion facilitator family transporter [Candidatus Limnocylindria bacterium]|nr:cation diffusion facilitator family transporter [Candidatus Limnocylindria bacterium]